MLNEETDGIKPGKREGGFGFTSTDLPGVQMMRLSSSVSYPDDPSDAGDEFMDPNSDIAKQYHALVENDYVPRLVAAPAIHGTNQGNVASLLRSIQIQSQGWVGMQLLDPALSAQFDRLYQAALDASTRNNAKAAAAALREIRKQLKKEHEDLDNDRDDDEGKAKAPKQMIDKLAAWVLDFDLKYVERLLGAHHDLIVDEAASLSRGGWH